MYPNSEPQLKLESWKEILVNTPEKRLKLYLDVTSQIKGQRLQAAITRNNHYRLVKEQMVLLGAVMTDDGFIVCKSCLKNHCGCWFDKQTFKACLQHRRYLGYEQSTKNRFEAVTAGLVKLKENLVGIEHYLKLPSKFVWWAVQHSPSARRLVRREDDVLSFGYNEWPKHPEV